MDRISAGEIVLNHTSRCIPVVVALAAVATIVAGCSDTRFGSNASTDPIPGHEQAYKTGYGFDSSGPTTDVYTELFGSRKRDDSTAPASVTASAQPGQPGQPTPAPGPPTPGPVRQGAATPPPSVNQQQAAAPPPAAIEQPDRPPPQAAGYGFNSDGPTTDVYTMLFGSRH
jgi:hypothetical protein